MMNTAEQLHKISVAVASAPFLTQGGGGNTSVKSEGNMLIKASGFRLDEINPASGYVNVATEPIVYILKQGHKTNNPDKEIKQISQDAIIGDKTYLPSMETGFHAVLNNFVIHTHPIAVNAILCCESAEQSLASAMGNIPYVLLPYLNPGWYLSKAIADYQNIPSVIFLKNHGLIVHADTAEQAIQLHENVIAVISAYTGLSYLPSPVLNKINDNCYEWQNSITDYFLNHSESLAATLFPDQAVVIGSDYLFTDDTGVKTQLLFNTTDKKCVINGSGNKAKAIAENLVALAAILKYAESRQLRISNLPDDNVAYILGMDMEKYRQRILKG